MATFALHIATNMKLIQIIESDTVVLINFIIADLTGLCYYSDRPTCCKRAISLFKCKSVTNVQVGGITASVTHYQREGI